MLFRKKHLTVKKKRYINSYISNIESKLFNLGYPYKMSTKKYLIIKYVLSSIAFLIAYINYSNIKIPIVIFLIVFCIPDYLLRSYKKQEKYILINELKNMTNSLCLCLSAYTSLKDALIIIQPTIKYKRLKDAYDSFVREYLMNGYRLKEPASKLDDKFSSYDLSLFLTTVIQGDAEGNLLECLEKLSNVLELNYFKYLKRQTAIRLSYVTLGTVISLINIVLVVMYPIFTQVINNLQIMFS